MEIIVSVAECLAVSKINKIIRGTDFRWVYLGENIRKIKKNQHLFGEDKQIHLTDYLQNIAYSNRQSYLDYIGELGLSCDSLEWWASSVSEKNPYISKTFLNTCYMIAVERILANLKLIEFKYVIVITEEQSLLMCLNANKNKIFKNYKNLYFDPIASRLLLRLINLFSFISYRIFFLLSNIYRIIVCTSLCSAKSLLLNHDETLSLIFTWCHKENLVNDKFSENYWGPLNQYLTFKGRLSVFVPQILRKTNFYKLSMLIKRQRSCSVILIYQYLKFLDIIKLFIKSIRKFHLLKKNNFLEYDISALIENDFNNDWLKNRPANNNLIWFFIKRLSEAGVPIRQIFYLYENQPWEKTLCLAVRSFLPAVKTIAYQHACLPFMYLPVYLSAIEKDLLPLPDKIITSGEAFYRLFANSGYPIDKLISGVSLRYQLNKNTNNSLSSNNAKKQILVTTATGKFETAELINAVHEAFLALCQFDVIIKCHPDMPFKKIKKYLNFKELPLHFSLSFKPVSSLLANSDLLIFTSSTTAIEALLLKVDILHFSSSQSIDLNPIINFSENEEFGYTAFTTQQLLDTALNILTKNDQRLHTTLFPGQQLFKQCFAPIINNDISVFLIE